MWKNSPSSTNSSLHSVFSSANFNLPLNIYCYLSGPSSNIVFILNITSIILILPLCILIFYYGLQERLKRRSTSSAATSHADCFTYHMATMELVGVFGSILTRAAVYKRDLNMFSASFFFITFTWYGQMLFHLLTCVERYLAVLHPITYRGLRTEKGVRNRYISIGCVWLLCFVGMALMMLEIVTVVLDLCIAVFCFATVSFCSLSVLCALVRTGPGEQGKGKERFDQMKLKAFYTMLAILGVLLLRFVWGITWSVLYLLGRKGDCVVMTCGIWSSLPSSLVLPLLFLQRAGKCCCAKKTNQ